MEQKHKYYGLEAHQSRRKQTKHLFVIPNSYNNDIVPVK